MNESLWIASYLCYYGDRDKLIAHCIKPIIEEITQLNLVSKYFWVRNSDGGPHIRLRFKVINIDLKKKVSDIIKTHATLFFNQHPSFHLDNISVKPRLKNDTVTFSHYLPEIERYGGPVGMIIAESQFQLSSDVVMNVLNKKIPISTDDRIKISLALQITLFAAFENESEKLCSFFKDVSYVRWTKIPELIYKEQGIINLLQIRRESVVAYFKETSIDYPLFIKEIYNSIVNNGPYEYSWMADLIRKMTAIAEEITIASKNNQLIVRPNWQNKEYPLWGLIESYCHMTHNRLGTRNLFEGYIAKLISDHLMR